MSFYRPGGPSKKKKVPGRKKPAWDDSVNDLTLYRATPDEVLLRKESHKSKNHISVKLEKMRKERQNEKLTGADLQKLAIMKEILYDQHQLQQVLAKSDSMMAVVKDLFGDDPKRSMGFPNVTTAPQSESASSSLVQPIPDIYTRSEKLSDSVMNQSAINDVNDTDSDEDDGIDRPEPISYKSKLNLQHFQEYLQEEERKTDHMEPQTLVARQNTNMSNKGPANEVSERDKLAHMLALLQQGKLDQELLTQNPQNLALLLASLSSPENGSDFKTPPRNEQRPPRDCPPSAINDTQKVKKTKTQVPALQPVPDNPNITMTDMRKALKDLEFELASYEHQTGRLPKEDVNKSETFSGYTVALVSAVSRLTRYLKEADLRIRTEVTLREQLTQDVYQLRAIIDALASDLIMTQEEYAKLYSENQRCKETTAVELASMNKRILELQTIVGAQIPKSFATNNFTDHQSTQPQEILDQDTANACEKSVEESRTSTPNHNHSAAAHMSEPSASSGAVLLSPVVRKTRVHSNANATGMPPKRQTSLLDLAVSNSSHSGDPPQLTQAPPVMKSISVPRPISLVQSNLPVPLTSSLPTSTTVSESMANGMGSQESKATELIKLGGRSQEQLHQLQELDVEQVLQNPALQDLMQTQIAELNRQQEEARKRLRDLLANQKLQQQHLQQHLGPDVQLDGDFFPLRHQQQQPDHEAVSPPISPIPGHSHRQENLLKMLPTKGITLTLPMADLDVSGGSLSSPPRSQGVKSDD